MQLDTRSLLMNYIDLRRTNDVQLTFDALLVRLQSIMDKEGNQSHPVSKRLDICSVCFLFK